MSYRLTKVEGLHATTRDKQVVSHMLENGWDSATTKRRCYWIERSGDLVNVTVRSAEKDSQGRTAARDSKFTLRILSSALSSHPKPS